MFLLGQHGCIGKTPLLPHNEDLMNRIKSSKGLIALWDFKEEEGCARKAYGVGEFPLVEMNGTLPRIKEGPLSGYSIQF